MLEAKQVTRIIAPLLVSRNSQWTVVVGMRPTTQSVLYYWHTTTTAGDKTDTAGTNAIFRTFFKVELDTTYSCAIYSITLDFWGSTRNEDLLDLNGKIGPLAWPEDFEMASLAIDADGELAIIFIS